MIKQRWNKEIVYKTVCYAMEKHKHLSMKGEPDIPFAGHFVNVMLNAINFVEDEDVDQTLIIQLSLLHDSIEDAGLTWEDLNLEFGKTIADGVLALSRNEKIPFDEQIPDCIARIKQQKKEVAIVKMADRLYNIRNKVDWWSKKKVETYKKQAQLICDELGYASLNLKQALQEAIDKY